MGDKVIAIIDSGVEKINQFKGVSIESDDRGNYFISNNIYDENGHGTIVANMIQALTNVEDIFIVKIFGQEEEVDCSKLVFALKYLREVVKPQIIHLSLGISFCDNIKELRAECDMLYNNGTIIVCAYDNNGSLSYPAAFDNVIGVESHRNINKTDEYYFLENSPINIAAIGCAQRLLGKKMEYLDVEGSSFAAPYITAFISNEGMFCHKNSFDDILSLLRNKAKKIFVADKVNSIFKPQKIGKAITFPSNKEINTLLRFSDYFTFELIGIFDVRYMRNIGKDIYVEGMGNFTIHSMEKIDWKSDFDTVILGHVDILSKIAQKDYLDYFVRMCIEHKKNIYSFDPVPEDLKEKMIEYGLMCFTPEINSTNVPHSYEGKMRQINKPILCITGTSSKQGKFSLQLQLKKHMSRRVKIGMLATEPTGYLVGAEVVFPMGYNSNVQIENGLDYISAVNYAMGEIEDNDPDLILTGTQSQTIPMQLCSTQDSMIFNHYFLLGANPDAIILVVNVFDEIEYIERTIRYLESVLICDVIAIGIFPIQRLFKWGTLGDLTVRYDNMILENMKNKLIKHTQKHVFIVDDEKDVHIVAENCLKYFTEE